MKKLKKNNLDIDGYRHNIDVNTIKHIGKKHGNEKTENLRGQIAITDDDIKNIPYIIDNADYIIFGSKNNKNQDGIIYIKNMDDGTSVYVEEIRTGRKTLSAETMFKRKGSLATADATSIKKSLSLTSKTLPGSYSIVENPNKKVKGNDILEQQQNNKPLAQIEFRDTQAVISLFENANKSSLIHEMGHYFLRLTKIMAESGNSLAKTELEAISKFLKRGGGSLQETKSTPLSAKLTSPLTKGGEFIFTREQEELFARNYEGYLRRGIAPSSKLKTIFDKFSQWLKDVYKSVKELNINLNQDVIDFFDRYLDAKDALNAGLQKELNTLQNEIDKEREVLYQEGLSEEEVESKIDEKYGERIKKIEEQIKSSKKKSKDYDFKKYMANMELAKQQEKDEASKRRKIL